MTALLGEADVLAGQVVSPRTPPDTIASFVGQIVPEEEWIVQGVCAYVPQVNFFVSRSFVSLIDGCL